MTVKQLKEFLNNFPEDYNMFFYNQEMSGIASANFATICTSEKRITLLEEFDTDDEEENEDS